MPPVRRRRTFVDRSLFSTHPPSIPSNARIPAVLTTHFNIRNRLRTLLDIAFPPINAPIEEKEEAPTIVSFRQAVHALDAPLNLLVVSLDGGAGADPLYVRHSAEAQTPVLLVDMLARMLCYRALGHLPPKSPQVREPIFRKYVSIMHRSAAIRIVDNAILGLLRAMNAVTASSELLSLRLSADQRLLPLLFDSIRCVDAVEVALALIEEALHASRRANDFDLSSVHALPELVQSLSPFQLGSFCRVLAPLVDERDMLCGGDHCSGACSLSLGAATHDFQQIEPSAAQLRARRSYVGAKERVVRERNHAVLLSIPGLIERLVKLISVPPSPREELALVDHALRSGVFTLNFELGDAIAESPAATVQGALFASIRAGLEPVGEVFFQQLAEAQVDHGPITEQAPVPANEEVRQRILFMLVRRLTGMDNEDADNAGTGRWEALDNRIARAVADYDEGIRENGIFRERRPRVGPHGFAVAMPSANAENHAGSNESTEAFGADGPGGGDVNETQDEAGLQTPEIISDHGTEIIASPTNDGAEGDHELTNPQMSINGLLLSSHQIEVLFVLYSLLVGRRKSEVQSLLVDADIFSVLNRFCDALDWKDSTDETKTEESLKAHFIRLLHYMCEGFGGYFPVNRRELLFTEQEKALLKAIDEGNLPILSGFGSSLTATTPTKLHHSVTLGLHNHSLSSGCASSGSASISSNGKDSKCSSIQRGSLSPLLRDNIRSIAPVLVNAEDSDDDKYPSLTFGQPPAAKKFVEDASILDPQPGIICKIVKILVQTSGREEIANTRRCLLSGCIETFLRSAGDSEKTLIAYQGLLLHLLRQLSESTNMQAHISQFRQTSFDLLGQLVKWNRDLFNAMNEIFRRDPKLLPKLLEAVSDRLVDSNVFIRSVVISLERFRAEDELERVVGKYGRSYVPYDFDNCLLWEFVESYRIQLIHDLLSSVRVEDVNFENICCVNTTLIMFVMTCPDENTLDLTLAKIEDIVLDMIASGVRRTHSLHMVDPVDIFENFSKLVDFWLGYYQYQGMDVASQEISSNIHFDKLVSVAKLLQDRLPRLSERVESEAACVSRNDCI